MLTMLLSISLDTSDILPTICYSTVQAHYRYLRDGILVDYLLGKFLDFVALTPSIDPQML